MIRLATRSDLNLVTDLLTEFLLETSYNKHTDVIDTAHIKKLVFSVLQHGYIWLYFNGEVAVGLLVAVKEQNVFGLLDKNTEAQWVLVDYSLCFVSKRNNY
jgi:hypothetical protein